jgi:hypothetical protein
MMVRVCLAVVPAALSVWFLVSQEAAAQYVQAPNGHLYQAVVAPGIAWLDAAAVVSEVDVCGKSAHLATVTS